MLASTAVLRQVNTVGVLMLLRVYLVCELLEAVLEEASHIHSFELCAGSCGSKSL